DSSATLRQAEDALVDSNLDCFVQEELEEYMTSGPPVVATMIDYVLANDSANGVKALAYALAETNVGCFELFAEAATEILDLAFVEPLLKRLESDSNPYVYLPAVKALMAYNDLGIESRIRQSMSVNPALTNGWGVDSLNSLLHSSSGPDR
ncbi:MAG TPA: hypothetical protein VLB27_12105, partial [candidate division Zixibacteria bacterium]|nr:hypothetical protein [candidate division Zixibacteria bacterium]